MKHTIAKKKIEYELRPTVDFAREAEAAALNIKRDSLDRATLLAAAVRRLRREGVKKVS